MIPTRPRRLNGMRPYSHRRSPTGMLNKMSETICLPPGPGIFIKATPQLPLDKWLPTFAYTLTIIALLCLSVTRTFQVTSAAPLAGSVPLVRSVSLPKNLAACARSGPEILTGPSERSLWPIWWAAMWTEYSITSSDGFSRVTMIVPVSFLVNSAGQSNWSSHPKGTKSMIGREKIPVTSAL